MSKEFSLNVSVLRYFNGEGTGGVMILTPWTDVVFYS